MKMIRPVDEDEHLHFGFFRGKGLATSARVGVEGEKCQCYSSACCLPSERFFWCRSFHAAAVSEPCSKVMGWWM